MILLGVLRSLSVDDALKEMEFTPLIAERVEELSPPTPEELRILREEIDPDRVELGQALRYLCRCVVEIDTAILVSVAPEKGVRTPGRRYRLHHAA